MRPTRTLTGTLLMSAILPVTLIPAPAQEDDHLVRVLRHKDPVLSIAFSPDAKILASGGEDQIINLWDVASGDVIRSYQGHNQPVRYLSFSADGVLLLSAAGTSIHLWNIQNQAVRYFSGHVTHVWNAIFSSDEKNIISTSLKSIITIWDAETASKTETLSGHSRSTLAVAVSNDGAYLASGSLDQSIILRDYAGREILKTINAHAGNIYSLCFSPDNQHLVSASRDATARVWDVMTGQLLHLLEGHERAVMQASYSPDGLYIVTASYDRTARIWEAATGKSLYVFGEHDDVLNAAAFSPDMKYIATASHDGTVMIWKMSPRYIAEAYYWTEIQEEFDRAELLKPRERSESRPDYELRVEKAMQYREEVYARYCAKHMQELKVRTGK